MAKRSGAKIIEINPEETVLTSQSDISLHGNAAEILPLIFAEVNSSIRRLPDDKTIKFTAEQTRKEKQVEDSESQFTLQNPPERNQPSKYSLLTSESHPLRVDFIASEEFPILTKLGMTLAPGKKQMGAITGNWDRDLVSDLMRLRDEFQTETLVSLIEENELAERGIQDLEYECRIHGIELIRFPLRDVSVPASLKSFARLIREITKRLKQKKTVVIHLQRWTGTCRINYSLFSSCCIRY